MKRYFLELCYDGASFGGFQIQNNVDTIQGAVQAAMKTLYRTDIELTGASRTDAGVHALQNFFHFDTDLTITQKQVYNLNAILPNSIVIKAIYEVPETAHARFDATTRSYIYKMHTQKDPFLEGRSWYYPFPLDLNLLEQATQTLLSFTNYESFSKKNTSVNTFECTVSKAFWQVEGTQLYFHISSNRFLRGMIRGLVGTLLQVGRGQISLQEWSDIVTSHNEQRVDFSTPAYGLYLSSIIYPDFLKKVD
jgi:tRNA pseudouridine38-40 synthase